MSASPGQLTLRMRGLTQAIDEPDSSLYQRVLSKLGIDLDAPDWIRIARRSLDARRRDGRLRFVCQVDLRFDRGALPGPVRRAVRSGTLVEMPAPPAIVLDGVDSSRREQRAVVVGSGPAGVFAAWVLARNGLSVTVLERGARLDQRGSRVVRFHRHRVLDPETNLLFGEGGAGTYSDGKLYTRRGDPLEPVLLEELVECGAPEDILYDSRAHIGTDRLHRILPQQRQRLEALGVRFEFETRLEALVQEEGPSRRVRAVRTSRGELPCELLVLALGHSARDTHEALHRQGLVFEAKPFQLGVRVEHPQELVTRGCYGTGPEAELLGAASYALVSRSWLEEPGAHSFCMCPGGRIVASVHEEGRLCTNGMSNSAHSSGWANAALVTTLEPEDFAEFGTGPFAGVAMQRAFEERFFQAGGGDWRAPSQRVDDFLAGRLTRPEDPRLRSSYRLGLVPGRIDRLVPEKVRRALLRALPHFDRILPGFAGPQGLFVGVETRSSGPVRIPRSKASPCAVGFENLLAVGEGAGQAGGIMSAALDAARSSMAWLQLV